MRPRYGATKQDRENAKADRQLRKERRRAERAAAKLEVGDYPRADPRQVTPQIRRLQPWRQPHDQ